MLERVNPGGNDKIYQVVGRPVVSILSGGGQEDAVAKDVFTRIHVKRISYLEKPSMAIHFQDMTQHVKQVRLESQILEEKNRNTSLQSYTSTMQHEFRTPLATALMFLAHIAATLLSQEMRHTL